MGNGCKLMLIAILVVVHVVGCIVPATGTIEAPAEETYTGLTGATTTAVDAGEPDATLPETIDASVPGLHDSLVVCETCGADLLAAKTVGIINAMDALVTLAGADILPQYAPATFHLDDDPVCGTYVEGVTTGSMALDAKGKAHVCTHDMEKTKRDLPFDVAHASSSQDQLLPTHEATHMWFLGRVKEFGFQEPFCKYVSFVVSEAYPDPCDWFQYLQGYPDHLMSDLCQNGMAKDKASAILAAIAMMAQDKDRPLSIEEVASIVGAVLEQDVGPAFKAAGLLQ